MNKPQSEVGKEKCEQCGGKATLVCEEQLHYFCKGCREEEEQCPVCQPVYLMKL